MKRLWAAALALLILWSGPDDAEAAELKWVGCQISKNGFMEALATAYEQQTGNRIVLDAAGATKGIRDVAAGAADLGGSSRRKILLDEARNVRLIPLGWDAIVAIVHPSNPVTSLSTENLKAVFEGRITNWSELGGADAEIKLVVREDRLSGVGLTVREFLFSNPDHEFPDSAVVEPSSDAVEARVEKTPHAIAFTGGTSATKRDVSALRVDGQAATYDNIKNGLYELVRPLYLVMPKQPRVEVADFAAFATGPDGQQLIKLQGTVTLDDGGSLWSRYRKIMKKVRDRAKKQAS